MDHLHDSKRDFVLVWFSVSCPSLILQIPAGQSYKDLKKQTNKPKKQDMKER